jgi:Phytanoyl-CoA dioxygenase (PhyH)
MANFEETGSLGVRHLKRFWSRIMRQRGAPSSGPTDDSDWIADSTLLGGLGLNLRETLRYLYDSGPTFEQFEQWVLEINGGAIAEERIARLNAALTGTLPENGDAFEPALSAGDLEFFDEQGYVVLHDAVPADLCRASERAIWEFTGGDPEDCETWYSGPQGHSIWLPLLHHPAICAVRSAPRIFAAFAELWRRTDLWPTIDQSGFNPPERPGWPFPGPRLHWDMSLALPIHFNLQGMVYLTDTDAHQGAFVCVPGFHRRIESWLRSLPPGADPRRQALTELDPTPIAGCAGDLIIWHHSLPHGSSPNTSSRPRIVQYIALRPSHWTRAEKWI